MDAVYERMTAEQRGQLSAPVGEYVKDITGFALSHLDEWAEAIAETVARVHEESPGGERFIIDPVRTTAIVDATLFLDSDSQLVSVRNARINWIDPRASPLELVMEYYQSYEVLTGPNKGRRFTPQSRPLPDRPVYRPGVVLGGVGICVMSGVLS